MTDAYVDLDRRFIELDEHRIGEDFVVRSYTDSLLFSRSTLSWNDLFEKRLTVVLGEPGSGKTIEFRNQASAIKPQQEFTFFIRLENLISEPLRATLSHADESLFDNWLASGKTACFLLDSVDEAKIRRQSDFESALHRFAKEITPSGLDRARIVLSSRVGEWRPQTDASLVNRIFGKQRPTKKEISEEAKSDFHVVRLLPLDKEMVKRLLEGGEFENVDEILAEFDRCLLWPFLRRPIDALRYASSLRDGVDLNSLTSILHHDISERLRETNEREQNDLLTKAEAMAGASTLGAAVLFTQKPAFLIRDEDANDNKSAIDAANCLPSTWSSPQVMSMLNRAVFDAASRGTVRFHHRSVTEYLAAEWLSERVENGCPIPHIENILCDQQSDGRVIREGIQPVLAWLACGSTPLSTAARGWILEAAPDLFFSHGDPSALSVDYRSDLLEAYVFQHKGRESTWTNTDPETLSRFGDSSLAPKLSDISMEVSQGEDLRIFALWIARHAKLVDCLDAAVILATDPNESARIRTTAATVVRDAGDIERKQQFAKLMLKADQIPGQLVGVALECIFPDLIEATDLADMLSRVEATTDEMRHESHWLLDHFQFEMISKDAIELLIAILPLVQQEPVITLDGKPTRLSVQHQWLGGWFPALLEKAMTARELQDQEAEQLAVAWAWLEEFSASCNHLTSLPDDFAAKTVNHKNLRQEYFWLKVAAARADREFEPKWAFQFLGFRSIGGFEPLASDAGWLLSDMANRTDVRDQELALRIGFDIYLKDKRPRRLLKQLKSSIAGRATLKSVLRDRLSQTRFFTLKSLWYKLVKEKLCRRYWWKEKLWRLTDWYKAKKYSFWLIRNVNLLSNGDNAFVLANLAREAKDKSQSMRLAPISWDLLRQKRGRRVAEAVAKGCRKVWQSYSPELPHEKEAANTSTYGFNAGLAGLTTGIESGEIDLNILSLEDVRKAVRYATGELNGFPQWFELLVNNYPDVVRELLLCAVEGEWRLSQEDLAFGVLNDVRWGDEKVRELLSKDILDLLEKSTPESPATLKLILQCFTDSPNGYLRRLSHIGDGVLDSIDLSDPTFKHWIVVELQLDTDRALNRLDHLSTDSEQHAELVKSIIAELSGEDLNARSSSYRNAPLLSPLQLKRLLLFCHRFIKPDDDIERSGGGAYSPTTRDAAQRFRDSIVTKIADNKSSEAAATLTALLEEPELNYFADYTIELINRRRRSECVLLPWSERDVADFATKFETNPKSSEELFVIMLRRLLDLRYQVEASDNSIREELRIGDIEAVLRRWLARKLDHNSRGRYRIPQEVEIDQEQRPDLRAECPAISPVPIEVKWAERWSYNDLVERLENQLVGQYLRAHENQYGVYLLCYIDPARKQTWRKPACDSLDFANLVEDLQQVANVLVERNAEIRRVAVVGIDFRQPT